MGAKYYPFQIGSFDCAVLLDGRSIIGEAGIKRRYPTLTEAEYHRAFAEIGLSVDEAESSLNICIVRAGDEIILVDTGEGQRPERGNLLESMKLAGFDPSDVTMVVITHSHGDHVLGLVTSDDQAAFPNARYVISNEEWAFWQGRIDSAANQRSIVTMMESRGLRLIAMDEEIIPGIMAIPIPGHTPGQIGLLLESGGEKMLHLADLLHSPVQFAHPEWSARFDVDTSVSVPTRRTALARIADEGALALFYHLPFPGLGRVRRTGQQFDWEPVVE